MAVARIPFLCLLLVAILHGAQPSAAEQTTPQAPTNSSQHTAAETPTGAPAKLESTRGPPVEGDVSEIEVESPSRRVKERPGRLERMDNDFFPMSSYGMDMPMPMSMPMQPRNYFYPHMMAPTLPPYEGRRPSEDRNAGRPRVPHPRLVAPPPSSINAEMNTISGADPNFRYEEGSQPYGFRRPLSPRKKAPQVYDPIYFDDDDATRRPYSYGVRSRPIDRMDPHFKPSFFEMPNGHSGAFETEPIPDDTVTKRSQGDHYERIRQGFWQPDKKSFRPGKGKSIPVPSIYAIRERIPPNEAKEATFDAPILPPQTQIKDGYKPPYRSFVLGPAGYQLVAEADGSQSSASTPSRVEHFPVIGETRRRLITFAGAKEYFSDESEDYFPSGGFKPLSESGQDEGKKDPKKEE